MLNKRTEYIDRARAFGMFLMYYTHFVEKLYREGGVEAALTHWKIVCAFLMQFFFFLAGMFWKPAPLSIELFVKKLKVRLLPSIFFSLLIVPLWLEIGPKKLWKFLAQGGYLFGKPLNTPLWYLICLMSTELLAALIIKYFKISPLRIFIYAFLSFCFGYYILVVHAGRVTDMLGIDPGIWYVDDAFVVIVFYYLGYLSRKMLVRVDEAWGWWASLIVMPIAGFLLWNAYQWNSERGESVLVLISASQYGNIWYFLLASLIGIVFLLAFSRLLVFNGAPVSFIAQNSLIFLGLNGISFHFLDIWVIKHLGWLPTTFWEVFALTSVYTLFILVIFSPLAWGIRRWFPELSGFEWTPTSLLPPMREWGRARPWLLIRPLLKPFLIFSEPEEDSHNG